MVLDCHCEKILTQEDFVHEFSTREMIVVSSQEENVLRLADETVVVFARPENVGESLQNS